MAVPISMLQFGLSDERSVWGLGSSAPGPPTDRTPAWADPSRRAWFTFGSAGAASAASGASALASQPAVDQEPRDRDRWWQSQIHSGFGAGRLYLVKREPLDVLELAVERPRLAPARPRDKPEQQRGGKRPRLRGHEPGVIRQDPGLLPDLARDCLGQRLSR